MNDEKKYFIAFSVFPGVGPMRFNLLYSYFGSAKAAWEAPSSELKKIKLGDKLTDQFDEFRKNFSLDNYIAELHREHVSVLTLQDDRYPKLLAQISDAPFVLYVKGKRTEEPWDIHRAIGMVGTRKMSHYGEEVTRQLTQSLVAQGFTIVSGLAYGVDAVAHRAALEAGGKTIAVLGCGIDIIAPPSNATLYHDIAGGGGAIVSEMPLGLRPIKGLFPARNRIISGLSLGVVVTEGTDDSGALITARYAGEQGREVFAVPGPITSSMSKGPSKLLKNGAKLVESADDIVEELGFTKKITVVQNIPKRGETAEEERVLGCIRDMHVQIDEIARHTDMTISQVATILSILEIKGIVKDYGDKEYGML